MDGLNELNTKILLSCCITFLQRFEKATFLPRRRSSIFYSGYWNYL